MTDDRWERMRERGSEAALRAIWLFYRTFGRRAGAALLYPVAAWYVLREPHTRSASLDYLRTLYASAEGRSAFLRRPDAWSALRHVHEFAVNLFDRMVLWGGSYERIRFRHTGSELLFDLARRRQGAILLGAHLGSFDMMRVLATRHGLTVNVLMFTEHSERINRFFERRDPSGRVRLIQLVPGSLRTAFEIRACIERGELVGILGDRLAPGSREPVGAVSFLGRRALLPLSAFLLAGALGCPLLAALCVRIGDETYEAMVKPLWRGGRVPRTRRETHARQMLEAYVRTLENACQRAPYQWFNFYDYWAAAEAKPA